MKKITFRPGTKENGWLFPKPVPASTMLPDWYKKTPLRTGGHKHDGIADTGASSNFTIKGCVPFLDAMTSGYMYVTPCDVEVSIKDQEYFLSWLVEYDVASTHSSDQAGLAPRASKQDTFPFKWHTPWIIKTPPGYSTMFVHPINRYDLPFRSFGGVVETDTYQVATQFPFQITKEVEKEPYIIPAGTPIIQAIPFKRENWVGSEIPEDRKLEITSFNELRSKIVRSYKDKFWVRKTYK